MPYEYRRMSPAEREEVLLQRAARRHPWHAPPHPYREAGVYLLTAACYEHAPLMAEAERRTSFEDRLLQELHSVGAEVLAWVVLPNHYHVLVGVDRLEAVSRSLKHLHGTTAREWNLADGETSRRKVWYYFSDRVMRGEAQFFRALNYVHINPVKHGHVDDPYDWPWSSLQSYLASNGRDWLRQHWQQFPPGDFGRDWDE